MVRVGYVHLRNGGYQDREKYRRFDFITESQMFGSSNKRALNYALCKQIDASGNWTLVHGDPLFSYLHAAAINFTTGLTFQCFFVLYVLTIMSSLTP